MTYQEQLQDVRWFSRRQEILERDDYCCQDCLRSPKELSKFIKLHVHHKSYIKGLMAWEYPDKLLITLCDECHKKIHGLIPDLRPNRCKPTFVYKQVFESRPIRHITECLVEFITELRDAQAIH